MENKIGAALLIAIMVAPFIVPKFLPATLRAANIVIGLGVAQLLAGLLFVVPMAAERRIWMFPVLLAWLGVAVIVTGVRMRRRIIEWQRPPEAPRLPDLGG